jgi:hypothetical protein
MAGCADLRNAVLSELDEGERHRPFILSRKCAGDVEGTIKLDLGNGQNGVVPRGLSCLFRNTRLSEIGRNQPIAPHSKAPRRSACIVGNSADLANCYARSAILGRNSITAIAAIRMNIANTTACVIANGGSDCVGASALRPETFAKLCATRTNTFK